MQPARVAFDSRPGKATFPQRGEIDFQGGDYVSAVRNWRHALVDDPRDGRLRLLLGQALFQTGDYAGAAEAVREGLSRLPQSRWGVVVENHAWLYGGNGLAYADGLAGLERAEQQRQEPALRFLLAYQYAFLGRGTEAVHELDKALESAPRDETIRRLRDQAVAKLRR